MKKLLFLSVLFLSLCFSCTSDDDCPEVMEVDINDPESIRLAEACGLSPAGPLGKTWRSEGHKP